MNASQLLVATLSELQRYVEIGDDYAMLRGAGLLRQLLMDASPLVHQVNRAHRLKLKFSVCGRRYAEVVLADGPMFYSALGGIHRSGTMAHQAEGLSLDEFLAVRALKLGPQILTIADLISIASNVLGGVHKGSARTENEQALERFNETVNAFGHPISAAQMKPVILVVLDALEPLANAVNESRDT